MAKTSNSSDKHPRGPRATNRLTAGDKRAEPKAKKIRHSAVQRMAATPQDKEDTSGIACTEVGMSSASMSQGITPRPSTRDLLERLERTIDRVSDRVDELPDVFADVLDPNSNGVGRASADPSGRPSQSAINEVLIELISRLESTEDNLSNFVHSSVLGN